MESSLVEKYNKIFDEASKKQRLIIENMKNEKLGLLNQIHSLKQLAAEMRTESTDLKGQLKSLSELYKKQGIELATERGRAETAIQQKLNAENEKTKRVDNIPSSDGLVVLKNLLQEYKDEGLKLKARVVELEGQVTELQA